MNSVGETHRILLRSHAGLDQLRIAGNGCQRGLQFMRHICTEFLPHSGIFHNVLMLFADHGHERYQFLIGLHLCTFPDILCQFLNGSHQLRGQHSGRHHAQHQQHHKDPHHHGQRLTENAVNASGILGQSQDAAISQADGIIKGGLGQGLGIPDCFTFAVPHGFLDLRTGSVIPHGHRICLIIIQYLSVTADQRQSQIRFHRHSVFLDLFYRRTAF